MNVEAIRAFGYVAGQLISLLTAIGASIAIAVAAWKSEARQTRWRSQGLSAADLGGLHPLTFLAVAALSNRADAARLAEGLAHAWPRTQRALRAIPWAVTAFTAGLALTYACRHLTVTGLTFIWAATMITMAAIAGGLWVGIGCLVLYDQVMRRTHPLRGAALAVGIALALRAVPEGGSRYLRRSSRARASRRVVDAFSRANLPLTEINERQRRALDDVGWLEFQESAARLIARAYEGDFIGAGAQLGPQPQRHRGFKRLGAVALAVGAIPVAINQLHEIITSMAALAETLPW